MKPHYQSKDYLNPYQYTINRFVLPISLCFDFVALGLLVAGVATENETVGVILFSIGLIGCVLSLAVSMLSFTLLYRKAAKYERSLYDFSESGEENPRFDFEKTEAIARFGVESDPFGGEFEPLSLRGEDALMEYLAPYGDSFEYLPPPRHPALLPAAWQRNSERAAFTIEPDPEDKQKRIVYESFRLSIDETGATLNGDRFPFAALRAYFACDNDLRRVNLYLLFGTEEEPLFGVKLGGNILSVVEKYAIEIENREELDFALADKPRTFYRVFMDGKLNFRPKEGAKNDPSAVKTND